MKVFLLGLDGMTLRVVEPYVKAGLLPNFKKVMTQGQYGALRSTAPPITAPAWTSLATGKNPGKHGIYGFRRREGYRTSIVTKNTSPQAEPIWSLLSRKGKSVKVLNVPFTYPPDKVNGVMVCGMMAPNVSSEFVYPPDRKDEVLGLCDDYQLDVELMDYMRTGKRNVLLQNIRKNTEDTRALMHHFLKEGTSDLFYIAFIGPDRMQHFLWDDVMRMCPDCVSYYQLLDDVLGDVLANLSEDSTLLIVSDHGFRATNKIFHVNNFLEGLGLLQFSEAEKKRTGVDIGGFLFFAHRVKKVFDRVGLSGLITRMVPGLVKSMKGLRPDMEVSENEINWEKTKAFSLAALIVSLNLVGREPGGIVEESSYQELLEEVRNQLLALEDPETGGNVVREVLRGAEIYSPVDRQSTPDLVVICNEGYSINSTIGSEVLAKPKIGKICGTGDHDLDGIFLAYGSKVQPGRTDVDICDIMPTILYVMDQPIPHDVDGKVITGLFTEEFVNKSSIEVETAADADGSPGDGLLEKDEEAEIARRLRNIGYVD